MMTLREIIGYEEIYEEFRDMIKSTTIITINEEDLATITQLAESDDDFDTRLDDYVDSKVKELPSADEMWLLVEEYITINVDDKALSAFVNSSNALAEVLIGVGEFMSSAFKSGIGLDEEVVH